MRKRLFTILSLCISLAALPPLAVGQAHVHPAGDPEKLGRVDFAISCREEVRPLFNQAVAMLHSFWYEKTAETFAAVAQKDPGCAMAQWGIAMSHYHPLWEKPNEAGLKAGAAAVAKARAAGTKTDRERDYVRAIEAFYKDFQSVDHVTRVRAYEQAMEDLQRRYPDDREAAIFYALSLLGTATAQPPDPTYANQRKAGELLTRLFQSQPDHPGLAHYIIHSYDYPSLAGLALDSARRYAKIAPDSPHALHMPSHIFTRLGLWQESVGSNLDSAAAARKHGVAGDELHAMDYLMYAYLQRAEDRKAEKLLREFPSLQSGHSSYFAGLFAMAAMPARHVLERRDWAAASVLETPAAVFTGGRYAFADAMFSFARGIGAARGGKHDTAQRSVKELASFRDTLRKMNESYWADQVEIQRLAVEAWIALKETGEGGLVRMRAAADLEDRLGKHPVTPGAIVPARELLGDMLLELKRPAEAAREYETVLQASPNRLNALYGVARACEAAGELEKAKSFNARLAELTADAEVARAYLAGMQKGKK